MQVLSGEYFKLPVDVPPPDNKSLRPPPPALPPLPDDPSPDNNDANPPPPPDKRSLKLPPGGEFREPDELLDKRSFIPPVLPVLFLDAPDNKSLNPLEEELDEPPDKRSLNPPLLPVPFLDEPAANKSLNPPPPELPDNRAANPPPDGPAPKISANPPAPDEPGIPPPMSLPDNKLVNPREPPLALLPVGLKLQEQTTGSKIVLPGQVFTTLPCIN